MCPLSSEELRPDTGTHVQATWREVQHFSFAYTHYSSCYDAKLKNVPLSR